jgi:hypothetical protein
MASLRSPPELAPNLPPNLGPKQKGLLRSTLGIAATP